MPLTAYFTQCQIGTDPEPSDHGHRIRAPWHAAWSFFFSILLLGQMSVAAALMLYYNWVLFLLLLSVWPLVWLTNRYFHPRLGRLSRKAAESSSRLTGNLAESVRGIRVIQGFARQGRGEEIFNMDLYQGSRMTMSRWLPTRPYICRFLTSETNSSSRRC